MRTLYFGAVSSFVLLFFLAQSQRSQIGCLPYFYTWCQVWPYSAILECRSEMCCDSLEMQDQKKSSKIRHLGNIAQLCRAISSQLRHVSTIEKKLVKQQYLPTCPHNTYGGLRPTPTELKLPLYRPCTVD